MKPQLKHKVEFKKILSSYRPSRDALQSISDLHVVVLAGATGAGRNTIINELVHRGDYEYFVSDTTRPMRTKDGQIVEKDGREYWFINEEQMLQQLRNGEMMEAALIHEQQVSGTSIREFQRIMQHNKIAISEIEPQGVATYKAVRPETVAIFVIPPNFTEWMQRLNSRAQMHQEELNGRLNSAVEEFEAAIANDYYHIVVNIDYHNAATEIDEIVKTEISPQRTNTQLNTIKKLLLDTQSYLQNSSH